MTANQKFARYKELCEAADEAMDIAIETRESQKWHVAEARNSDAAQAWTELRDQATPEMIAYHRARTAETLKWLQG